MNSALSLEQSLFSGDDFSDDAPEAETPASDSFGAALLAIAERYRSEQFAELRSSGVVAKVKTPSTGSPALDSLGARMRAAFEEPSSEQWEQLCSASDDAAASLQENDFPSLDSFRAGKFANAERRSWDQSEPPRTLGRVIPLCKEESSPAARRKAEKMAAQEAAAKRKEERRAEAKETVRRKQEEKAAAKREAEERVIAKREAAERAVAEKIEKRLADKLAAEERKDEQRAAAKRIKEERRSSSVLLRAFSWLKSKRAFGAEKQMRVSETLALGEKRFVAVLLVDGRKFLIGGGSSGVSLLTSLENSQGFAEALQPIPRAGEQWQ
jgi:hypothetical protein